RAIPRAAPCAADADVFGFLRFEKGVDVITDFQAGIDKIDLSDFNTDFAHLKLQNSGNSVIVTVGQGKAAVKFKILGYQKSDVDGSFFQF
ncbi:MAG TPA: M10 family metallopeptidase C-terminal domain-containing protein, partial [Bauldia sp.]|nr:M10 family metallopeptidase C-terminal domain-containing protein [Bauldia sp.]